MSLNIKEIRQKLNLTQGELSAKTGIPRDRIAKWEQGKGSPKAEDFTLIQKLLGEEVPAVNPPETKADYLPEYIQSILEQKRILEEQNQFLRRNFEVSLSSIAEAQQVGVAHLKALAWYSASVQAGENEQETNKELIKINTRVGEYLLATVRKDM